jgi:hypothetical protein
VKVTKDWIRGYLDRGCHIQDGAIVVDASSDKLLRTMYRKLRRLGLRCAIRRCRDRFRLRIAGRPSLRRWKALGGFLDPEKVSALDHALKKRTPHV